MLRIDQTTLNFVPKEAFYQAEQRGTELWLYRLNGEILKLDLKGIKGDKGATPEPLKGERGLSAYEKAVALGKTNLSERDWLMSYKGEQGEPGNDGQNGSDGSDGLDGSDIVWKAGEIRMISSKSKPKAVITKNGNEYTVSLEIPESTKGDPGEDGRSFTLSLGKISSKNNGQPEISLKRSGNNYEISIIVVRGKRGSMTDEITEAPAGKMPIVDLSAEMIDGSTDPKVEYKIETDPLRWLFKLKIPYGDQPEKGTRGPKGYVGSSNIHYTPIKGTYSYINNPMTDTFFAIQFTLGGKRYFGWSIRKDEITIQEAFAEDLSRRIYRKSNSGFENIEDGWIAE